MKYHGPPQSGSVAATTYSRNRYGQYTRARVGRGGTGDTWFATVVAAWQTITDDDRKDWSSYAAVIEVPDSLGNRRRYSGFQAFLKVNLATGRYGGSVITNPSAFTPSPFTLATAITYSAAWSSGQVQSTIGFPAGTFGVLQLFSSGVVTAGTMSPPGRGKYWKRFWGESWGSGDSSPLVRLDSHAWEGTFGVPPSGSWVWIEARPFVSGVYYSKLVLRSRFQVP